MEPSTYGQLRVHVEDSGALVLLELNHGKANECGRAQLEELGHLVSALRADGAARALVVYSSKITQSGKPIFVSGANVTERVGWTDAQVKAHVVWQRAIMSALHTVPVFCIMVVDGLALGLGTELLLAADYRIATPRARLGLPETGLGIIPGALGTAELAALVGVGQALYLGATGAQIGAEEASRIGLVQELASDQAQALERARAIVAQVKTRSPSSVAGFKRAVKAGVGRSAAERAALEAEAYERLVDRGEAAVGRAHFKDILDGKTPPWPPKEAG